MSIAVPERPREIAAGRRSAGEHPCVFVPAVVYLAAARNTYGTLGYRRAVATVSETWPRSAVMDAEGCGFASKADWSLRWPFIRDGVDAVVVLAEGDGTISRDTWHELNDARASDLPCFFVNPAGGLTPGVMVSLRPYPSASRTDRRWAKAVLPEPR